METVGQAIWALGLMSGTSMDGADAALLRTDGITIAEFGPGGSVAHDPASGYREAMDRAASELVVERQGGARSEALAGAAAELVTALNTRAAKVVLAGAKIVPEVIGFHGQTIFHDPAAHLTCQLGSAEDICRSFSVATVSDFRTADMAAGGEGAPLAPFFHFACAKWASLREPVAFLNLGGVGNLTWVDPSKNVPEETGALLAFDTGPANALLDDFVRLRRRDQFDKDGVLAAKGRADAWAAQREPSHPFFARKPPKSLDRNEFSHILELVSDLRDEDGAAALTAYTGYCLRQALVHLPALPSAWFVCGGGRKNPVMMREISAHSGIPAHPVEELGLDGDMLEAQAFAYLAVRVLRGLPTSAPSTTGCRQPVCGGRISAP